MPFTVLCPSCGVQLSFNEDRPVGPSQCPSCSLVFTLPTTTSEPITVSTTPKLRFICPSCQKLYKARAEDGGRKTLCKQCGAKLQIPELESPAAVASVTSEPEEIAYEEVRPERRGEDAELDLLLRRRQRRAKERFNRRVLFGGAIAAGLLVLIVAISAGSRWQAAQAHAKNSSHTQAVTEKPNTLPQPGLRETPTTRTVSHHNSGTSELTLDPYDRERLFALFVVILIGCGFTFFVLLTCYTKGCSWWQGVEEVVGAVVTVGLVLLVVAAAFGGGGGGGNRGVYSGGGGQGNFTTCRRCGTVYDRSRAMMTCPNCGEMN